MCEVNTIDLRYLAESQPSLCIPRVFNNITETRIRQVFDDLGLGKISRIDIKERKTEKGDSFKRVYVHFDKWFWNEDAQAARRKLISGKEVKIVYDNPWFWKVSASKWAPNIPHEAEIAPHRSRAHIEFDDMPRVTDEYGRRHETRHDDRRRPDPRGRRYDYHNVDYNRRQEHNHRREKRSTTPTLPPPREEPLPQPVAKDHNPDVKEPLPPVAKEHLPKETKSFPPPPPKRRTIALKPKQKPEVEVEVEIEEVDVDSKERQYVFGGKTEKDKQDCEDLYGDL